MSERRSIGWGGLFFIQVIVGFVFMALMVGNKRINALESRVAALENAGAKPDASDGR